MKEKRHKAQKEQLDRLKQLNVKLEEVRKTQRIKKVVQNDLIKKGATF